MVAFLIVLFCTMMSGRSFIYNFRIINGSQETANISYRILPGDEIFSYSLLLKREMLLIPRAQATLIILCN